MSKIGQSSEQGKGRGRGKKGEMLELKLSALLKETG
jgi:hypothetical protein